MNTTTVRSFKLLRLALLPLLAVAVAVALMLSWGQQNAPQVQAGQADGQININLVDANDQGKKLSGSCWLISVSHDPPGDPEEIINKPVDVVSDNNAKSLCDDLGPIKADLSDKDPAKGSIGIDISAALLTEFGTVWHFEQVQAGSSNANPKISYNLDDTKYTCTLSGLFKKLPPNDGVIACDEADPFVIKNVRKDGIATFRVNEKTMHGSVPVTGFCVSIFDDPPANTILYESIVA